MSMLRDLRLVEHYKPCFCEQGRAFWKATDTYAVMDSLASDFPTYYPATLEGSLHNGHCKFTCTFLMDYPTPIKGAPKRVSFPTRIPYDPKNCYSTFRAGIGA